MKDGTEELLLNPAEALKYRKPTEEEVKMYHNCISNAYFSAGLPFAVLSYYFSSKFKKPGNVQPRPFAKSAVIFILNSIAGTFFLLPYCYSKFSAVYLKNVKREQEQESGGNVPAPQLTEGTLPPTSVEDFSYPTDVVTQFNESDSNFSGDFSYSKLLEDDSDRLSPKFPTTTYSDLRARHRNEQTKATPSSSLNVEKSPGTPSSPFSKREEMKEPVISSRPVRRNKYGDEME